MTYAMGAIMAISAYLNIRSDIVLPLWLGIMLWSIAGLRAFCGHTPSDRIRVMVFPVVQDSERAGGGQHSRV